MYPYDRAAYLGGPMRGIDLYNFPLFLQAAQRLRSDGWIIVSPAEHDLMRGFDPTKTLEEQPRFNLTETIQWDLEQVCVTKHLILLPGWVKSKGCAVEFSLADFLGHPAYEYTPVGGDYRLEPIQ